MADVQVPNEEEVKVLMDLGDIAYDNKIKVQCIGTLGCLAQYPDAIDANKVMRSLLGPVTFLLSWIHTGHLIISFDVPPIPKTG